jgi:hypothetical protein
MTKRKSPNELYWESRKNQQIREQYEEFLQKGSHNRSLHSAHLFAMRVLGGSSRYLGYSERELILLLAGELPYMYD